METNQLPTTNPLIETPISTGQKKHTVLIVCLILLIVLLFVSTFSKKTLPQTSIVPSVVSPTITSTPKINELPAQYQQSYTKIETDINQNFDFPKLDLDTKIGQ